MASSGNAVSPPKPTRPRPRRNAAVWKARRSVSSISPSWGAWLPACHMEIRNPLAAIFLHVDCLEEEFHQPSPESSEAIAEALTEIKANLARLDDLLQDYLSLVRVSTIQREVQDLGAAMQDWYTEFKQLAVTQ